MNDDTSTHTDTDTTFQIVFDPPLPPVFCFLFLFEPLTWHNQLFGLNQYLPFVNIDTNKAIRGKKSQLNIITVLCVCARAQRTIYRTHTEVHTHRYVNNHHHPHHQRRVI